MTQEATDAEQARQAAETAMRDTAEERDRAQEEATMQREHDDAHSERNQLAEKLATAETNLQMA